MPLAEALPGQGLCAEVCAAVPRFAPPVLMRGAAGAPQTAATHTHTERRPTPCVQAYLLLPACHHCYHDVRGLAPLAVREQKAALACVDTAMLDLDLATPAP